MCGVFSTTLKYQYVSSASNCAFLNRQSLVSECRLKSRISEIIGYSDL